MKIVGIAGRDRFVQMSEAEWDTLQRAQCLGKPTNYDVGAEVSANRISTMVDQTKKLMGESERLMRLREAIVSIEKVTKDMAELGIIV